MNGSRGKGKHRGRSKKKTCENNAKTDDSLSNSNDEKLTEQESITLDLDADITQLEAPTFSTINKGPPEPMLRLNWDHKTHLIGEKVINPMIHCCDKCEAPILIYGRMIPCKHVFCFCCAERQNKTCPRCQEKIVRIEKTGLGSVFMCTFGGTRYGNNGCRRTYLSQRDLMAHINHRHIVGTNNKKETTNNNQASTNSRPTVPFCTPPPSRPKASIAPHAMAVGDPRKHNSAGHDHDFKTLPPPSHSSLPQSSYRPQSQHPVHLSAPTPVPHPQRLVSSAPQSTSMTPIDYSNPMLVTNFSSPTSTSVPNVRNNVLPMPIHETNMESRGVSMNIPMAPTFAHQSFSSQYIANPPPNTAFSVPPPMTSGVNLVPQTLAQYYPNNAINYSTSLAQRSNSLQYSNSPTSMMNQPRMVVNSSNNTSRRSQYLAETTGPPLPVPPPQRWHQLPSNQTHFY